MPDDLLEVVDIRRFGPGERIVFEPYTREMFERTQRWMRSWELLDAESVASAGVLRPPCSPARRAAGRSRDR